MPDFSPVQSLEIVGRGHENPSVGEMIMGIKAHIEGGNSFAAGLGQFPLYFDDLVVNLVDAGEKSGTLETLLDTMPCLRSCCLTKLSEGPCD